VPDGLPVNQLFTQTQTTNPITGYTYPAVSPALGTLNVPIGGGGPPDPPQYPIISDVNDAKKFFGFNMGTLLYVGVEFTPVPLQLPAYLMGIPPFGINEAISQQQYNVTFHFDFFLPQEDFLNVPQAYDGHNCMPFSGNSLWYAVQSQRDSQNGTTGPFLTPFNYMDFSDLFVPL
jgi:hypothetical protein